jgi:hypothetical protein
VAACRDSVELARKLADVGTIAYSLNALAEALVLQGALDDGERACQGNDPSLLPPGYPVSPDGSVLPHGSPLGTGVARCRDQRTAPIEASRA